MSFPYDKFVVIPQQFFEQLASVYSSNQHSHSTVTNDPPIRLNHVDIIDYYFCFVIPIQYSNGQCSRSR